MCVFFSKISVTVVKTKSLKIYRNKENQLRQRKRLRERGRKNERELESRQIRRDKRQYKRQTPYLC